MSEYLPFLDNVNSNILIVDDNQNNLYSYSQILQETHTHIFCANSGEDALKILLKETISLILIDVNMPSLNGFETVYLIKSRKQTKDIPVIFISGNTVDMDVLSAFQAGAVDFIIKPVDDNLLKQKVKIFLTLFHQKRQLEKTIVDLKETQSHLLQAGKLVTIGTIASGIAHEVSNPLAVIYGFIGEILIELKKDDSDKQEIESMLNDMKTAAERMIEILDHLRDYSYFQKGEQLSKINVNDIINNSLIFVKKQLKNKKISIKLSLENSLPSILGNSNKLESIFINLMVNARDAFEDIIRPEKIIAIKTSLSEQRQIQIEMRDNASGIPNEIQENIFRPFFTTKKEGKGTGLGLFLIQMIVKEHNGAITLQSRLGEGSCFTITFPICSN